ncbi:hypothetical protein C8A01DRAFT_39328 [Parachaetomium inaequale]|uniref:EKC/KEOPS complex subunit BUD32 n=1 Tax=Parachaetomium inaequale TaxID=2588326 RepID=A0AAN6SNY4_9PEZI|nr:hypothetical protein C8A01DRAFT_39328 [Parachaetomium inaequale]
MPIANLFPFLSFLRWPGEETDQHQQDNKEPGALDLGRFGLQGQQVFRDTHMVSLYDPDTRRVIVVTLPNPDGFGQPAHDPALEIPLTKAAEALTKHLDHLPPAAVAIEVDKRARLLSFSTNVNDDETWGTDYLLLKEYKLPRPVANRTVLRSELYEAEHTMLGADIVSYLLPNRPPRPLQRHKDRYAFKYWTTSTLGMWHEIQIVARLPRHPNLILLDRLVLDEQTGSKVVGFTTRFIAGRTLDKSRPRFKLRWLRQLMQAIDDLNLKHGIIHQDIAHRNILIDSESDSLALIDFGEAYRIGVEKRGDRDYEGKTWN